VADEDLQLEQAMSNTIPTTRIAVEDQAAHEYISTQLYCDDIHQMPSKTTGPLSTYVDNLKDGLVPPVRGRADRSFNGPS